MNTTTTTDETTVTAAADERTPRALSLSEVAAIFGVLDQTVMVWVEAGTFPRPYQAGGRRAYWHPQQIEDALLGKAPGRRARKR
jgi:predicted DNA-binding transcriptional regulator AlpA